MSRKKQNTRELFIGLNHEKKICINSELEIWGIKSSTKGFERGEQNKLHKTAEQLYLAKLVNH